MKTLPQWQVLAFFLLFLSLGTGGVGCARAPVRKGEQNLKSKFTPAQLLSTACAPGMSVHEVKGVAWMKAKSPDASGQFPASIHAVAPASLTLEVQQPLGGTLAVLTTQGRNYQVEVPGKPERNQKGRDHWAGIPLNWAAELFLGRIPCPDPSVRDRADLSISEDDELWVHLNVGASREASETYVYRFEEKHGAWWPKSVHWQVGQGGQGAATARVDFTFDDPEERTLSPLRWEAKSKQGEVKIRWRDREVLR